MSGSKKKKKKSNYTIMFIPEDNGKTFSLHLHKTVFRSLLFFLVLFLIGVVALLFKTGEIGVKLQLVHSLREENRRLEQENSDLQLAMEKIERIEALSSYLQRVALAVGENPAKLPLNTLASSDKVIGQDSLDVFLNSVRLTDSDQHRNLLSASISPTHILASIPNIRPVEGWITRSFTPKTENDPGHLGVDFAAAKGSLIRVSAPGIVDEVLDDKYFGLMVVVKHNFGFVTRYAHCSQILVSPGDNVERGQSIALVGNTGRSSGPHLHYEVIKGGKHVDPLQYTLNQLTSFE